MVKKIGSHDDSNGDKVAASVTIKRGADMTARGRKQIAGWLRRQADFLEKNGDRYLPAFTSRWRYSNTASPKVHKPYEEK